MVSRRGGVLLRPMQITSVLSGVNGWYQYPDSMGGFNGQSRALPLRATII
ncbi:hypothetical protein PRABACTJOHN_02295 [Parabacteroides johnsonii DSM 18315]|uniref:Uncharacterized protein n=1 Tax=Parabacteroides johnsonii DSM 18315 TaxID=537006 RepID=B7BB85_9BACT|nr:hypothetical protein PRABACTJOHN_02295 [Parabacteroides johnsonii DSM 18315]